MTNFNRDNAIGHTINKQVKAISTSLKDKFKSLNKNYFNCSLEDPTSEPNPSQKLAKAGWWYEFQEQNEKFWFG